ARGAHAAITAICQHQTLLRATRQAHCHCRHAADHGLACVPLAWCCRGYLNAPVCRQLDGHRLPSEYGPWRSWLSNESCLTNVAYGPKRTRRPPHKMFAFTERVDTSLFEYARLDRVIFSEKPRSDFSGLALEPLERIIYVARVRGGVLRIVAPRRIEVGERFRRQHLLFALAFVDQLLDAVVR